MGRRTTPAEWSAPSIRTRYIAEMTRYLRIAAAGFFVLLAIALIGLWVRSYYYFVAVSGPVGTQHYLDSSSSLGVVNTVVVPEAASFGWTVWTTRIDPGPHESRLREGFFGLRLEITDVQIHFALPHWFLVACSFALAAVLTFKRTWRFSIRSILIAMTLLAVALGIGVYFA